jgi:hypothetical protein
VRHATSGICNVPKIMTHGCILVCVYTCVSVRWCVRTRAVWKRHDKV